MKRSNYYRKHLSSVMLLAAVLFAFAAVGFGQYGGKAEPKRIQFPKGRSSTTLVGSLSNGQEMEYVFGALGDQKALVKNANARLFDVRIFNENVGLETEFESSPTFLVDLVKPGDYMLFVRRKAGGPKSARFSIVLTIK